MPDPQQAYSYTTANGQTATFTPASAEALPDASAAPFPSMKRPDGSWMSPEEQRVARLQYFTDHPEQIAKINRGQLADVHAGNLNFSIEPEDAIAFGAGVPDMIRAGVGLARAPKSIYRAVADAIAGRAAPAAAGSTPPTTILGRLWETLKAPPKGFGYEGGSLPGGKLPDVVEMPRPNAGSLSTQGTTSTQFGPMETSPIKPTPKGPATRGYINRMGPNGPESNLSIARAGETMSEGADTAAAAQRGGVQVTGSAVRHNLSNVETWEERLRRILEGLGGGPKGPEQP